MPAELLAVPEGPADAVGGGTQRSLPSSRFFYVSEFFAILGVWCAEKAFGLVHLGTADWLSPSGWGATLNFAAGYQLLVWRLPPQGAGPKILGTRRLRYGPVIGSLLSPVAGGRLFGLLAGV